MQMTQRKQQTKQIPILYDCKFLKMA